MRGPFLVIALGLAGACAPVQVPVETAERQCADMALSQTGRGGVTTSGSVAFGVASSGGNSRSASRADLTLSTDLSGSDGRDPNQVFTSCVVRRSGQYPTRPLYDRG